MPSLGPSLGWADDAARLLRRQPDCPRMGCREGECDRQPQPGFPRNSRLRARPPWYRGRRQTGTNRRVWPAGSDSPGYRGGRPELEVGRKPGPMSFSVHGCRCLENRSTRRAAMGNRLQTGSPTMADIALQHARRSPAWTTSSPRPTRHPPTPRTEARDDDTPHRARHPLQRSSSTAHQLGGHARGNKQAEIFWISTVRPTVGHTSLRSSRSGSTTRCASPRPGRAEGAQPRQQPARRADHWR